MSARVEDPLVVLRPMREHDIPSVVAIERRCYDFPWSVAVFSDCLCVGYCCWTIFQSSDMAGYGIMTVAAQECHILNICVDLEFRRQGYAGTLLDRLLESAASNCAKTAYLEVRPSNRAALKLYIGAGFTQKSARPRYYPAQNGREDALVLRKQIGRQ